MISALLLALLYNPVAPAAVDGVSGQAFQSEWRIDPAPLAFLDFRMAARPVLAEHAVLRAAVKPEKTVALEEPLVSADGNIRIAPGARFMVQSSQAMLACQIYTRSSVTWTLFNRGSENMLCLIDADRDGRFDHFFTRKYAMRGFLDIAGTIPDALEAVAPAHYEPAEAQTGPEQPMYQLEYGGRRRKGDVFRLSLFSVAGAAQGAYCLTKEMVVPVTATGARFDIAGAEIFIRGYDASSKAALIEIGRPFAPARVQCND